MAAFMAAVLSTAAGAADTQTRNIMHDVAEALEVLLPLSLDSEAFLSRENRDVVSKHLSSLESAAQGLAEHGSSRSLGFRLLAAAFSRAATRLRRDFEELHPMDARFFLVDLTQHCVACHSRDAAGRDFSLSKALNRYLEEQPFNERERAGLQVALRQFDDAMQTWESVFSDPAVSPVDMALEGDFTQYLTVAVRVLEQYPRAAGQLEDLMAREDTPFYLRRRLETWIGDLEATEQGRDDTLTIPAARETFLRPETHPGLLWNDGHLVSDLALSGSLRRFVESEDPGATPEQLAEAYYMLGVLEARTTGLYSALPTMERFWEAAIRAAPDSPYAVDAYALIEEYAATTFSGSLPFEQTDETFNRLSELRSLIGIE